MGETERPGRAFTLIEMLVAVACVAVLIALLLPGLRSARNAARATQCRANLREWACAVSMYAQQSGGWLPRRGQGLQPVTMIDRPEDWFNALPPLLDQEPYAALAQSGRIVRPGGRGLWMCPRAEEATTINYLAYGMNMRLSTWQVAKPDRIDNVAPPALQVFLTDAPGAYCAVLPAAAPHSCVARHDASINIAFLDAHVSRFREEYVGCGVDDPRRYDVQWLVPNSPWSGP